jgi:peptide/nickel transport system substrate-binding protein
MQGKVRNGFLLLAMLIAGCAPPQTSAPAGSQALDTARAENQRLNWGVSSLYPAFDPMAIAAGRLYDVFETLTTPAPESFDITPMLATSWRLVDATTWEFKLRQDSRFHNGDKLTAADVKFSMDRYMDPALRTTVATRFVLLQETKMVDDYTVQFVTKSPDPILARRLFDAAIMPKNYIEQLANPAEFGQRPVGSGPWKVQELRANDRMVLAPFTEHPTRKPIFTEIVLREIPEAAARVSGLRSGDLDMIGSVTSDQVEALRTAGFAIDIVPGGSSGGCFMDTDREGSPLQDKRVRLALHYAFDRDQLSKVVYRGLQLPPQGQPVPRGAFGFNPDLKPYPYDVAQAKRLLVEAGYSNGFKMTIDGRFLGDLRSTGELIQSSFREIGIDATLNHQADIGISLDNFRGIHRRSEMACHALNVRPAWDAEFALTWFVSTQPGGNGLGLKHYENPEFDRVYLASTTEMDVAKREKLLHEAMVILHNDPPWFAYIDTALISAYNKSIVGIRSADRSPYLDTAYRTK